MSTRERIYEPIHPAAFIFGAAIVISTILAFFCASQGGMQAAQAAVEPVVTEEYVDARAVLDGHAERGVEIIWTSDPAMNCGATAEGGIGGCFQPEWPEAIVLSPELYGGALEFVTLHEYRHVQQYREALPLDECDADAWAISQGADARFAHYSCEVNR